MEQDAGITDLERLLEQRIFEQLWLRQNDLCDVIGSRALRSRKKSERESLNPFWKEDMFFRNTCPACAGLLKHYATMEYKAWRCSSCLFTIPEDLFENAKRHWQGAKELDRIVQQTLMELQKNIPNTEKRNRLITLARKRAEERLDAGEVADETIEARAESAKEEFLIGMVRTLVWALIIGVAIGFILSRRWGIYIGSGYFLWMSFGYLLGWVNKKKWF